MKVLLYQLDGKLPNVALMRLAAHHRALGDEVELRHQPHGRRELFDAGNERVYASLIFEKSKPSAVELLRYWPGATIGGTGWDRTTTLEQHGVTTKRQDYSDYPTFHDSIGFTQRGCRLSCKFCVVPEKEGKVKAEQTIRELWRGEPYPRNLLLLDNDFFGQKDWRELIGEMRDGNFKVCFSQGINARMLSDEAAQGLASIHCYDDSFTRRRIYTAWDNIGDEGPLFRGLEALVRHGFRADWIMVYVLCGFADDEENRLYRVQRLLDFGARPYPMPFVRTKELVGFQRWVVGSYAKRISWGDWKAAGYRPENLVKTE